MQIDIIDDYQDFSALKENWEAVYAADPEAQFFLSWTWMSKWLERAIKEWVVLAARDSDDGSNYVAFFPLRLRVNATASGDLFNDVWMACQGLSDYMGFICLPDAASSAIPGFATRIKEMKWRSLSLRYFCVSDQRSDLLLRSFPRSHFKAKKATTTDNSGGYDNRICPYVTLPDDWDTYLQNQVSTNTRQKIRRFLRKVETSDDYRITVSTAETVERDLSVLRDQWEVKWGAEKSPGGTQVLDRIWRIMLSHCLEHDALFMPVLWRGDKPLGILGSLIDTEKKTLLFFVAGRDLKFKDLPSGLVLHAFSIRHAISQGLTTYDFLRGNEPYKYSFGPQERILRSLSIDRKTGAKSLDERCLSSALTMVKRLQTSGRLRAAERGFRQILKLQPQNSSARLSLGQVLLAMGNRAAAEEILAGQFADDPPSST